MYLNKESLHGNLKSKFILIKDFSASSGVNLLKSICKLYCHEGVKQHVIYYESWSQNLHTMFDFVNITKTDAACDPCGWKNEQGSSNNMRSLNVLEKEVSCFKGIVCIDSLSPLLFHNDVNQVYKTIHRILKDNSNLQLIALMHTDVHNSYENEIMDKLATTALSLTPEDQVYVSVRYASGKVKNHVAEYKLSANYEFTLFREVQPEVKQAQPKKPDPTANLTFNLKLKSNEKEARSQLVLPYMQMQQNDAFVMIDDMYDEEDPDDDLEI